MHAATWAPAFTGFRCFKVSGFEVVHFAFVDVVPPPCRCMRQCSSCGPAAAPAAAAVPEEAVAVNFAGFTTTAAAAAAAAWVAV